MNNQDFLIRIIEYTVSIYNPDKVYYLIKNDQILINGEEIKGDITDKINKIKNIISSKKNEIETISNSVQRNYKGGIQKALYINVDEKKYIIIGNTTNKEAAQLYIEIKEEINKIINEVF